MSETSAVGSDPFDQSFGLPCSESLPYVQTLHHEAIFSQEVRSYPFTKKTERCSDPTGTQAKTHKTMMCGHNGIASRDGRGGSGGADVNVKWGGRDGVQVSGSAWAEYHDEKGNFAELRAEQRSDGTGDVKASGGRKKE